MNTDPAFFPMMVNLRGKKCVVVGGGRIAADKIAGLLRHGARIVVVSPLAKRRIQTQAQAGKLAWKRRAFAANDVAGAFLVVAAANSPGMNEAVFRACNVRGVLCNAVDDPEHCDFFYPAVVRRGPLQIAISTNGLSPALAGRLRRQLEREFGPEWGAWVQDLGKRRREILGEEIPPQRRRKLLLEMVSPQEFRAFLRRREREHSTSGTQKRLSRTRHK